MGRSTPPRGRCQPCSPRGLLRRAGLPPRARRRCGGLSWRMDCNTFSSNKLLPKNAYHTAPDGKEAINWEVRRAGGPPGSHAGGDAGCHTATPGACGSRAGTPSGGRHARARAWHAPTRHRTRVPAHLPACLPHRAWRPSAGSPPAKPTSSSCASSTALSAARPPASDRGRPSLRSLSPHDACGR